jgi:high-affinity nickel-transport protein
MLTLLSILSVGFLLGVRHATDPDHVVAVTTIVSRQGSLARAAGVGALWGVGHTATIALLGGGLVVTQVAMPPWLGLSLEMGVAAMLVVLGLVNLSRRGDRITDSRRRPMVVGFVHGLAGTGAVVALTAPFITNAGWALAYLGTFGLGTIAGMIVCTAAIALPAILTTARFASAQRYLRVASGVLSVAFGLFLAHHIGVVQGLFTGAVAFAPR